jgi:hypothetical protein
MYINEIVGKKTLSKDIMNMFRVEGVVTELRDILERKSLGNYINFEKIARESSECDQRSVSKLPDYIE